MKKITYLNILFVLALLLGGAFANAEEVESNDVHPDQKPRPERIMLKDKIEQEKMIRLENKDVRPIREMRDGETQNRADLKANMEEKRMENSDKLEERKMEREGKIEERKNKATEMKERLQEKRVSLAEKWKKRAHDRLNAGYERLAKIIERLESRMVKIEDQGGDTARAKTLIANAKSKLEKAKILIEEIKNINDAVTDDESDAEKNTDIGQNDFVQKIKPMAQEVQKLLKSAHQDLMSGIIALKKDNRKEKLTTDGSPSTQENGSETNEQVQ